MKLKLMALLYFIVFLGLVYHPGCSTADDCTFDITGTWNVALTWNGEEAYPSDWTLTFSGSSTSGTVSGTLFNEDDTGTYTYTVSDCITVQIIVDYIDNDDGCHAVWIWDGTSISDTTINGTMTISYTGPVDLCVGGSTGTWTATKI